MCSCNNDVPGWETYSELSLAEKAMARVAFSENVHNMLYDFKAMKALECDNDGNIVDIVG